MKVDVKKADKLSSKKNVLIVFFVVIVLASNALFLVSKDNFSKKTDSKYFYLNPAASIIGKENLLVNFTPLRESLQQKYENREDYLVSLYFEYLPTGANISLNKDQEIWPASLIKIPVAMAAMKKIEDGKWKLNNDLVILDEDKDSDYGTLYKEETGTTFSIREFLRQTLVNSDNTAHFVLLRNLEGKEIEEVYVHLGLDDIIEALKKTPKGLEADNRMTAKRYSVFFRSLYNATYLTPEYSQIFLEILKDAPKEYLSLGFPQEVKFVHKTGIRIDDGIRADAGMLYIPERPCLLTVMIQKKGQGLADETEVKGIFEGISKEIYEYVSQAK